MPWDLPPLQSDDPTDPLNLPTAADYANPVIESLRETAPAKLGANLGALIYGSGTPTTPLSLLLPPPQSLQDPRLGWSAGPGVPAWVAAPTPGPPTNAELYEALFLPAAVIAAGSGINLQLDGQNRIATIVNSRADVSAQAFDTRLAQITVGGVATNVLRDVRLDTIDGDGDLRMRETAGLGTVETSRINLRGLIGAMAGANLTYDTNAGVINADPAGVTSVSTPQNSGLAGGHGSGASILSLDIDNLLPRTALDGNDTLAFWQQSSDSTQKVSIHSLADHLAGTNISVGAEGVLNVTGGGGGGDITSVSAGLGLLGGGMVGDVTLRLSGEVYTTSEQAKLAGIEASADVNPTGGEVVALIDGTLGGTTWQGGGGGGGGLDQAQVDARVRAGVIDVAETGNTDAWDGSKIPGLDASKIVGGVFQPALFPFLPASQINSGRFDIDRIPGLPAGHITNGEFAWARIAGGIPVTGHVPTFQADGTVEWAAQTGSGGGLSAVATSSQFNGDGTPGDPITLTQISANVVTAGTLGVARIPFLPATIITSGQFQTQRIPNLAASKITSGVLDTGRLAAGGTMDQVMTRTAGGHEWADAQGGGGGGTGDITAVTTGMNSGLAGGVDSGAADLTLDISNLPGQGTIAGADRLAFDDALQTKHITVQNFAAHLAQNSGGLVPTTTGRIHIRFHGLTSFAALQGTDELAMTDDSSTDNITKKITLANFAAHLAGTNLTADSDGVLSATGGGGGGGVTTFVALTDVPSDYPEATHMVVGNAGGDGLAYAQFPVASTINPMAINRTPSAGLESFEFLPRDHVHSADWREVIGLPSAYGAAAQMLVVNANRNALEFVNQPSGGGGTTVVANPSGVATVDLETLRVGSTTYGLSTPEGGPVTLTEIWSNAFTSTTAVLVEFDEVIIRSRVYSLVLTATASSEVLGSRLFIGNDLADLDIRSTSPTSGADSWNMQFHRPGTAAVNQGFSWFRVWKQSGTSVDFYALVTRGENVTATLYKTNMGATAASNFLGLGDTPGSYSGHAGEYLSINTAEDAIEFVTAPSGGGYTLPQATESALGGVQGATALQAISNSGTDILGWSVNRVGQAISVRLPTVGQQEAEVGAVTTRRAWSALRVAQAIAAQATTGVTAGDGLLGGGSNGDLDLAVNDDYLDGRSLDLIEEALNPIQSEIDEIVAEIHHDNTTEAITPAVGLSETTVRYTFPAAADGIYNAHVTLHWRIDANRFISTNDVELTVDGQGGLNGETRLTQTINLGNNHTGSYTWTIKALEVAAGANNRIQFSLALVGDAYSVLFQNAQNMTISDSEIVTRTRVYDLVNEIAHAGDGISIDDDDTAETLTFAIDAGGVGLGNLDAQTRRGSVVFNEQNIDVPVDSLVWQRDGNAFGGLFMRRNSATTLTGSDLTDALVNWDRVWLGVPHLYHTDGEDPEDATILTQTQGDWAVRSDHGSLWSVEGSDDEFQERFAGVKDWAIRGSTDPVPGAAQVFRFAMGSGSVQTGGTFDDDDMLTIGGFRNHPNAAATASLVPLISRFGDLMDGSGGPFSYLFPSGLTQVSNAVQVYRSGTALAWDPLFTAETGSYIYVVNHGSI